MVVDHLPHFFEAKCSSGFSSAWHEILAQVSKHAATYGIFKIFQVQGIGHVRTFLDFWGGRSANCVRLLCAITNKYGCHPRLNPGDHACLSDPITAETPGGSGWGNEKGICGYKALLEC